MELTLDPCQWCRTRKDEKGLCSHCDFPHDERRCLKCKKMLNGRSSSFPTTPQAVSQGWRIWRLFLGGRTAASQLTNLDSASGTTEKPNNGLPSGT